MSPAPSVARRMSRNKEIAATSQWYVLQVEPGAELEVASLVQGLFDSVGFQRPETVPSPQHKRSRRHANIPYRGLIFVCADGLEKGQLKGHELFSKIEGHELIRGFVFEPETYLFEFEGLQAEDSSGSVNEAVTRLNKLNRELHFSGQAAMLLGEAKTYTPGEKGRAIIDQVYLDTEGFGYPEQSDFIEVKMYYSDYHRQLINNISGVIDIVGGIDRPLGKRGATLRPADMELITVSGATVQRFAKHKYELYVIQTLSQGELAVLEALNVHRANDEAALFRGEEVDMFVNHVRFVAPGDESLGLVKKKFTGYLYVSVHLDTTSWHLIKNISKVSGFVGGKTIEEVRPLTARESNALFGTDKKRVEREYTPTIEVNYEIGDMVHITDGPFATYIGLIQEVNPSQERIKVQIEHKAGAVGPGGTGRSRFAIAKSIVTDVMFSQVERLDS